MSDKHSKKTISSKMAKAVQKTARLEDIYQQYVLPMSPDKWSSTTNLAQPSMLRKVPSKTSYSFGG